MIGAETLRDLATRRPFEPFTVRLSGGEAHEVRHPETIAIGKQRLVIVDPDTDRMAICSMLHVTSVETLQSST